MAAEKVNTRQKMINMMYLVFIAMLALNISKEVLGTLGILSEDMEKSTAELKSSIDDLYTTIVHIYIIEDCLIYIYITHIYIYILKAVISIRK